MKSPFWVNNVYSFGYWLKNYGFYPQKLPLYTYMDHGMTLFDTIPPHEIKNDAPLIFKFSPRLVAEYKKVNKKPVYCLLNPAIHYRVKNHVEQNTDSKGTIFFVAHSTPEIDNLTNWDQFISDLNNIPDEYKPIEICLHHHDMVKGLNQVFIANGFNVSTAGNPHENEYIKKFYSILKNYKFTMSNFIGSYTFYSIEMGIPFSLYGKEPIYNNKRDKNIELGSFTSYKYQPTYQKAVLLFSGFNTQISTEQLDFVNTELGKINTISRLKAAYLLYKALLQYLIKHPTVIKTMVYTVAGTIKRKIWTNGFKKNLYIIKQNLWRKQDFLSDLVSKNYLTFSEIYTLKYSGKKITTSVFINKQIKITDKFWYLHSLNELFVEEVYRFQSDTKTPLIIDCGSNIGLSIIYFKKLFPDAKILGFEPDGEIFKILQYNTDLFKLSDVTLYQKAVWINDDPLFFSQKGSVSGHITNEESSNTIKIQTSRLKDYLDQAVDFLKIDIEGAEFEILKDCEEKLTNVKNIFIEYHSFHENDQMIGELLIILKKAGFKVYVKEAWENMKYPFVEKKGPYFDLQLNIFGYKR